MEKDVLFLMKYIVDNIQLKLDTELSKIGITFQQGRVILFIKDNNNKVNQKKIEEYLNVSHATTRGLVKRLNENGYVYVDKDYGNGNNVIVSLTPKCDEIVFSTLDNIRIILNNILTSANLTKEELNNLSDSLNKICESVKYIK